MCFSAACNLTINVLSCHLYILIKKKKSDLLVGKTCASLTPVLPCGDTSLNPKIVAPLNARAPACVAYPAARPVEEQICESGRLWYHNKV